MPEKFDMTQIIPRFLERADRCAQQNKYKDARQNYFKALLIATDLNLEIQWNEVMQKLKNIEAIMEPNEPVSSPKYQKKKDKLTSLVESAKTAEAQNDLKSAIRAYHKASLTAQGVNRYSDSIEYNRLVRQLNERIKLNSK